MGWCALMAPVCHRETCKGWCRCVIIVFSCLNQVVVLRFCEILHCLWSQVSLVLRPLKQLNSIRLLVWVQVSRNVPEMLLALAHVWPSDTPHFPVCEKPGRIEWLAAFTSVITAILCVFVSLYDSLPLCALECRLLTKVVAPFHFNLRLCTTPALFLLNSGQVRLLLSQNRRESLPSNRKVLVPNQPVSWSHARSDILLNGCVFLLIFHLSKRLHLFLFIDLILRRGKLLRARGHHLFVTDEPVLVWSKEHLSIQDRLFV